MRTLGAIFALAAGFAASVSAVDLPAAYAAAIDAGDLDRLLAEINKQFDIPPMPVSEPDTIYPEIAGKAGAQGTVTVVVRVDETGEVRDVVIADSPGWAILEEAGRRAASSIRYRPAKLDDVPVAAWYLACITFYIPPPGG